MNGREIIIDPILPPALVYFLGALLLVLTVWAYWRVGVNVGRWRNGLLTLFRAAGIVLVLLLLLQPSRQENLPPPSRERVTLVAVDTSLSMKQPDADRALRLDAARNLLQDANIVASDGRPQDARIRLFEFNDDAQPVSQSIRDLKPNGRSTRLHKSVTTMLNSLTPGETANALILLTDGHDFELANPAKTGAAARSRQTPVYGVAFGAQGKVRDVAARIASFQPYSYVKQKSRVAVSLRLIGCEFETLAVQLLRQGKVVQNKRINADELHELPVEFEVTEAEVGQYEYEVRVLPLEEETDMANNSAITYLNVIDQQVRVLLLEGDPYWDTTFLQRSLMRNDKFDVDALISYSDKRVRAIRKTAATGELLVPKTAEQFAAYDVIFLGRAVERLLDDSQIALLDRYVKDMNGTVIFCRGRAFEKPAGELEPVLWSDNGRDRVQLAVAAEGRGLSAFRALNDDGAGLDALPDLLSGRDATSVKPLTATLATALGRDDGGIAPAIVHRRYGRGQVVSVGVEGLWRWGLNSRVSGANSPFDRYWDQMILWLLAGRDFIPTAQFSFRPNSANILLGEKAYFRLTMKQHDPGVKSVPLTIFLGDKEISRVNMTGGDSGRITGEFLPERTGRYRAVAKFPDNTTQESRFIVFTENTEETEVATDALYLRRLCESSGGRLLEPMELPRLIAELGSEKMDVTPRTRLRPIWNGTWVFYLAGLLFGLDWFLRRRWGLC
ncbi:MAG: hypothetical protein IH623_05955 [Verrucomicrobia bacterium]|nr:hypothetical protein [Verrucomicrobiota bacterium]